MKKHNYGMYGNSKTSVDTALTAVDNISRLIIACALVKGGDLSPVSVKTVMKKMKGRPFGAGCSRDIIRMIEDYIVIPEFYKISIEGVKAVKDEIGLA